MLFEISSKELLAGTRAHRRNHPEEKEQRLAWLRRERSANASFDEPDVKEFLNIYGVDLLEAVAREAEEPYDLLAQCATPIDRIEIQFWLSQLRNPESRRALYSLFNDRVVVLYCLLGGRQILSFVQGRVYPSLSPYCVYPPDTSTDFLADDFEEVVDYDRFCEPADYNHILSAIFAEWVNGRPKSAFARDFICTACERVENTGC